MTQMTNTAETHENPAHLPEQPPAYEEIYHETRNIPPRDLAPVGPKPFITTCPSCNQEILTKIQKQTTITTHLFALTLCLLECYCCAFIPYCISTCKNADHVCPYCSTYLGTYRK